MDRRTFLAASAALVATPALAQDAASLQATLERLRAEAGIPALGGAIVTPEGIAWSGVSGVQRRGSDQAVTLDSRWHLGSNTKAMTAALYARLVEQGRADWSQPLSSVFPDLRLDPAWRDVTMERLFGHRAGVVDAAVMPDWMRRAWSGGPDLRTALASTVLGAPPSGSSGAFSYSNADYIIAGAAIERIANASWETAMQTEVFGPLGMTSAGFGAPPADGPWGHEGAGMTPIDPASGRADNPPALGPAGTVHASLEDYAKFLRVFLTDGGGWLSPDSLRRLTTPVLGEGGQPYALGWIVLPDRSWSGGAPVLTHDGSNTMWLARASVAPGRRAAAICVANAYEPARPAIDGLTQALIAAFPS